MAHTCPDCGQYCTCNGDIDDSEFNSEEALINCVHYLTPECSYGNDSFDDDNGDYYNDGPPDEDE